MPAKPLLKPKRKPTQFSTRNWENIPENIIGEENAPLPDEPPDAVPTAPVRSATPWELYNEKAKLYDREMLREWEENLTILLIFASLFSAVLTVFIIASMPLLQDDPNGAMRDILITISKQLGNSSTPAYQSSEFSAPTWAVHVNFLFFASLGCSLVAALASVLALQWIRDYDIGLARVTIPRERAMRRHFRFEGVQKWWMPEIIAVLPTLLHIALLLFLGGLVEWLVHVHITVSITMVIALSLGGTFYIATQVCAAVWPSAPFRTPISRFLEANVVLIYANLYRPMEQLWHKTLTRQAHTKDLTQATDTTLSKMKITNPRFREETAIHLDILLPSSALSWLLGHVERPALFTPYIGDIMRVLMADEGLSIISQPKLKEKAEWAEIIEWFIGQLGAFRQHNSDYPPQIEDMFFYCSQIAVVLGEGSLLTTTHHITKSFPLDTERYQTSSLGLSLRFALWRNHSPFLIDSVNPPLKLFNATCRLNRFTSAARMIYLREIRTCMVNGQLSGVEALSCMSTLMQNSLDRFSYTDHHDKFRIEMYTGAIHALSVVARMPLPSPAPKTDVEAAESILDMYVLRGDGEPWALEVKQFYEALFLYFVAMNSPGLPKPWRLHLPMTHLLAHPTFIQVWGDNIIGDANQFCLSVLDGAMDSWKLAIQPSLLRECRLPAFIASWVFACSSSLVTSAVEGSVDWTTMVAELTMLADICQKVSAQRGSQSPSDVRPVVLLTDDSFPWVKWILASLDLELCDDAGSFIVATLCCSIRCVAGKTLYCPVTPERVQQITILRSPILIIMGCVVMGWEYERFIPPDDDAIWNSQGWSLMVAGLLTYAPLCRLKSSAALLLAISRHSEHFFDELILLSGEARTPHFDHVDEAGTDPLVAQVMQEIIPAFTNNLHLPQDRIKPLIDQWSRSPAFYEHFVTANGLDWLAARRHQSTPEHLLPPDLLGNHEDQIFYILFRQTGGKDGIRSLSADSCRRVLYSSIICDFPNDIAIQTDLLDHIATCYHHMQGFGATPVFREAGAACAIILNHMIIAQSCYSSQLSGEFYHGQVTFDSWCTETRELIAGLRGGQIEIFTEENVSEENH